MPVSQTAVTAFFVEAPKGAVYGLKPGAEPGTLEGPDGTIHPLRATFQSPYSEHKDRIGQPFAVQSMTWEGEGRRHDPMFRIRFEDGAEITAQAEEVLGRYATNWQGQDGL